MSKNGAHYIQVDGDKAVFKNGGKPVVEVPAKIESGSQKHPFTSLSVVNKDSKQVLKELRIGGTTTSILIGPETE